MKLFIGKRDEFEKELVNMIISSAKKGFFEVEVFFLEMYADLIKKFCIEEGFSAEINDNKCHIYWSEKPYFSVQGGVGNVELLRFPKKNFYCYVHKEAVDKCTERITTEILAAAHQGKCEVSIELDDEYQTKFAKEFLKNEGFYTSSRKNAVIATWHNIYMSVDGTVSPKNPLYLQAFRITKEERQKS